jgi:hypothetical protein
MIAAPFVTNSAIGSYRSGDRTFCEIEKLHNRSELQPGED